MFDQFFNYILPFVQAHGYWVVGAILLIENMGIPVPGELVLISSGLLAFEGKLEWHWIALAAILGAILGDNIGYWIGRRFGDRFLAGYCKLFRVSPEKLDKAQLLFLRYSGWAVFLGRFVALLRILAGPLAGMLGMGWRQFLFCNSAGAIIWVGVILGGSYLFGAGIREIIQAVGLWGVLVVIGILLYIKIYLTRAMLK